MYNFDEKLVEKAKNSKYYCEFPEDECNEVYTFDQLVTHFCLPSKGFLTIQDWVYDYLEEDFDRSVKEIVTEILLGVITEALEEDDDFNMQDLGFQFNN